MILRVFVIIIVQLILLACNKHYYKQKEDFIHYSLKGNQEKTAALDSIFKYKTKVDAETGKVIANAINDLTKDGAETTLGNFVCDALKFEGENVFKIKPDVVIVNRGGLRINLPKGDIKVATIFELMPFENEMVMLTVSGEKLKEFLPLLLEKKHPYWGLKVRIENNKINSVLINELQIDNAKNYNVVTSDYLAGGGDNFMFLKSPVAIKKCEIKIREALINYCIYLTENKKQIIPYLDGRLEISK
jgi:2',3'-cyclic-nucleotide 2'-phosphodiesterase (5'-nucleotidase family)